MASHVFAETTQQRHMDLRVWSYPRSSYSLRFIEICSGILEPLVSIFGHSHYSDYWLLQQLKAKFHYAIWFEAGSKLVADRIEPTSNLSATNFEPASNQLRSR